MAFAISIPSALGFGQLALLAIILIIGVVLIMILATAIHFILPIIAAVIVWLVTSSLLYAAGAFLLIAILQLLAR